MDELLMKISELTGDNEEVMALLKELKSFESDGGTERIADLQKDLDEERAKSERLEAELSAMKEKYRKAFFTGVPEIIEEEPESETEEIRLEDFKELD